MRVMILAAGRGQRMGALTETTPKPLLNVGGKPIIEWQIERLVAAGFREVVINHAYLGQQIERQLGDGRRLGARLSYSAEVEALETLGGVVHALRYLGDQPFLLVSGDIYTDFDYQRMHEVAAKISAHYPQRAAHLVLTANPAYHANGDMGLIDGRITLTGERLTYANIGVFHPRLFHGLARGEKIKLFPWIYRFLGADRVTGELFTGAWHNLTTADDLANLDATLRLPRCSADGAEIAL